MAQVGIIVGPKVAWHSAKWGKSDQILKFLCHLIILIVNEMSHWCKKSERVYMFIRPFCEVQWRQKVKPPGGSVRVLCSSQRRRIRRSRKKRSSFGMQKAGFKPRASMRRAGNDHRRRCLRLCSVVYSRLGNSLRSWICFSVGDRAGFDIISGSRCEK